MHFSLAHPVHIAVTNLCSVHCDQVALIHSRYQLTNSRLSITEYTLQPYQHYTEAAKQPLRIPLLAWRASIVKKWDGQERYPCDQSLGATEKYTKQKQVPWTMSLFLGFRKWPSHWLVPSLVAVWTNAYIKSRGHREQAAFIDYWLKLYSE